MTSKNDVMRALPSVDALLKTETARALAGEVGGEKLTELARRATDQLRSELLRDSPSFESEKGPRDQLLNQAEERLSALYSSQKSSGVRRVINATGVVVHTNLGRAPLSEAAQRAVIEATGYCSLEYDTSTGGRGRRGARAEDLLVDLTKAESALVVNNCAAAALLVLSTFAQAGETIVSRGELVEIGGDFRVPDVMAQSGSRMVEVGTTNRTHLSDYEKAINEQTRVIMRVHTSNYRIVGFTSTPSLPELAELAHSSKLLLYEDAGSGVLMDLTSYGIEGEPVIRKSIQAGVDVVTFSGDKLLSGPQVGLIVGRRDVIERMRKNPLYRALRADKLRLAALEATLEACARGDLTPVVSMVAMSRDEIAERARAFAKKTRGNVVLNLIDGESAVGGGAAPTSALPTVLVAVSHTSLTPEEIAKRLRLSTPSVVARILNDQVVLDLRTVALSEEPELENALAALATIA